EARIEVLAQRERVFGPGAVAQPLARVGFAFRPYADEVGASPLHAVCRGIDAGGPGGARVAALERRAQPQQPRGKGEREVQRKSRSAPRLVAAPQRNQPRL